LLELTEGYKCEHSKLYKIYCFELNSIIYYIYINLQNKEIVLVCKKQNNLKERIKDIKGIYNEIQKIRKYLENKIQTKD
jgi:hypothetical protein